MELATLTSKSLNLVHNDRIADVLKMTTTVMAEKSLPEAQTKLGAKHLPFDPVSEASIWEPSATLKTFLETNFRRSLSSPQLFNILEETFLPSLDVLTTPKLDKNIRDQIPQNYKKSTENRDKELVKVRRHVLNALKYLMTKF